jgi:hypothetical protein
MTQAVMRQARQYPGQERAVLRIRAEEPAGPQQMRAPIFEDKVVDHILGLAKVTEGRRNGRPPFRFDSLPQGADKGGPLRPAGGWRRQAARQ